MRCIWTFLLYRVTTNPEKLDFLLLPVLQECGG